MSHPIGWWRSDQEFHREWFEETDTEVYVYDLPNPEVGRLYGPAGELVSIIRERATVTFGFGR